jgi:hypothetical protein
MIPPISIERQDTVLRQRRSEIIRGTWRSWSRRGITLSKVRLHPKKRRQALASRANALFALEIVFERGSAENIKYRDGK